jgi:hypothetical protein
MNDLKEHWLREIEEIVPDDAPSPSDDIDDEAGDNIDLDLDNDCAEYDYSTMPITDSRALSFTGSFSTSPLNTSYSPSFNHDLNISMPTVGFGGLTGHYEGGQMPQSAGILDGNDMLFNTGNTILCPSAMAYASM